MNPTMSEYIEVSKKVYEATGLRDTFVTSCSADNLRFIVRNYGLNLYNEDASALGFDDPKYVVDMWELAVQSQAGGWGLMIGEETATTAFDSMVSDSWSRYQNSNELQAYRDATGKDISMVMIPNRDDATMKPATTLSASSARFPFPPRCANMLLLRWMTSARKLLSSSTMSASRRWLPR